MAQSSERFIKATGGFGIYQWRLCFIVASAVYAATLPFMVMTFSTVNPPWKCTENSTQCKLQGNIDPGDDNYDHRCKIPRSEWKYDVEKDFDSIVTEWDLVCDRAVYPSIANSMTFVTWMTGATLGSIISDKTGRKTVAIPSVVLVCLCGLISAFAGRYWVFAVFRSLMGIGLGGYSVCIFTLVMEYVGPSYRGKVGFGVFYGWTVALFTIALSGYLIQSWRTLSIILSVPGLLYFIFWWLTPESLRWLIAKGKVEQAKETFRKIAQVNKKEIGEERIASLGETTAEESAQIERLGDIRDLFSTRRLAFRTLVSWYGWGVCGMVYYGIFLSGPTLGGNMYLNLFITSLIEAVAMFIGMISLDKFGRRKCLMVSIWLGAVAMVMGAVLTYYDDGSKGFLAGKILSTLVLGMFSITIVFDGLYVYTSELFPTVVRNTGVGTSSTAARIGSASAPYIVYSKRVHPLMPCGIMAIFAVVCGILFFFLPETYNQAMPDTVQQVHSTRENEVESNQAMPDTVQQVHSTHESEVELNGKKDDEKIQSNDIKQPVSHLANV